MAEYTVQGLEAQVPPQAALLDGFQEMDTLDIVQEVADAGRLTESGQNLFAVVAKRDVADIMPQGNGFDEVFVQAQKTADRAGDFRYQLNMQDPVGDVIVPDQRKNLGFIDITAVGP